MRASVLVIPLPRRVDVPSIKTARFASATDLSDALERDRTRHLLSLAEANEAQVVAANFSQVDGDGSAVSTAFPVGHVTYSFIIAPEEYIGGNIPMGNGFASGYRFKTPCIEDLDE